MAFETLSDRLRLVAEASLSLCRNNFGANSLHREAPIHSKIGWNPTFYMKANRILLVAVEVNDYLFPQILKIAAHDIERYDFPIAVYQACSLDIFQKDKDFTRVNDLRKNGFGIITVDGAGTAYIQSRAGPLGQFISPEHLEKELHSLTPRLKVNFRAAQATYEADIGQGLQAAGQIIEALVKSICEQAVKNGLVPTSTLKDATADIIDALYASSTFGPYRAVLGGARSFVKAYRNTASHPAATPKHVAEKIRKCKAGFFEALRLAQELRTTIQRLGYHVTIQ
jgi:hypothetical protein